jgi:ubiquinone/menaquinone biosynthesis C-methylase UbiE
MTINSVYTLNDGPKAIEKRRLWNQHTNVFMPITGGLLPDVIRTHLESSSSSPAVADIACGTGVWLLDLAKELPPTSRLDGYDFDTSKFPEENSVLSNIRLRFANALEPFPAEVQGIYGLVHVRLVMFGLKAEQWELMATNLFRLLKPGGYLLWDELDYSTWTCIPMTKNFAEWISVDVKYALSVGRDPK